MTLRTSKQIEFVRGRKKGVVEFDAVNDAFKFLVDGSQVAAANNYKRLVIPALHGKVGATAGWVITAGTNLPLATLPASQTGSTLVIPIIGLQVDDEISSVEIHGQVDSGGNAVTVAATVRKYKSNAAAGGTDSEVIASANVANAVVADTLIDASLTPSGSVVVADDEAYYVLITGTTLATTDVEIGNIVCNVTRKYT